MRRDIDGRAEPFTDSRERVAAILVDACGRLSPDTAGHAPPTIETVRGILETATTTRLRAAVRARVKPSNRWRFLLTPRTRDDIGRAFLHRLHWHTGNGSAGLWSVYGDLWNVGETTFNTLDTVAAVFVHLFTRGGLSRSLNNKWEGLLSTPHAAAQRFKRQYETMTKRG